MPRRVTPAHFRSIVRQEQAKRRQRVQKHNAAVRRHNSAVKQAVDSYNRDVRAHNARVRANRNRLESALRRLAQQRPTVRYTVLRESAYSLSSSYRRLDRAEADPHLSDLAEREVANSIVTVNHLLGDASDSASAEWGSKDGEIAEDLGRVSPDLRDRWAGAIYALSPTNPDATRHFCVSAREIVTSVLDGKAPNEEVFARFPRCETTEHGFATRRMKVRYCLDRIGADTHELEDFVEADIDDILLLFRELNIGTHGRSGRFTMPQLMALKARAQDAIQFICSVAA